LQYAINDDNAMKHMRFLPFFFRYQKSLVF